MLLRFWRIVDTKLEDWLIIGSYGYVVLIVLIEVVRRYAFGASSEWGEMTARYAFVFLVYIGTAHISKFRGNIRIDLFPRILSNRGRVFLYLYFDFLNLLLVALTVYYSSRVMQLQIENDVLMTSLDLNMAFAQVALPIGFMLLGYRVIQRSLAMIKEYRVEGTVALNGGTENV